MWARCRLCKKNIIIITTYVIFYLAASHLLKPKPNFRVVDEDFSVGEKYSLIFLNALSPTFSDADGAKVFGDCGKCFLTNNKGFVPMDLFDAVLHDESKTIVESGFSRLEKSYFLKASAECLSRKLVGCKEEPKIILYGLVQCNLCQLCQKMQEEKEEEEQKNR